MTTTLVNGLSVEIQPLSKMDVKALREADRIVFRHTPDVATIECIKEVEKKSPFDDDEKRYHITVESVIRQSYRDSQRGIKRTNAIACFTAAKCTQELQTIFGLVKAGDELKLNWETDHGSNQLCDNVQLHADALILSIKREVKGRVKRMKFIVDTSVSLDNSARMIRL